MDMVVLVTNYVASYNQGNVLLAFNMCYSIFTCCTLLTKQESTKISMSYKCQSILRRLVHTS